MRKDLTDEQQQALASAAARSDAARIDALKARPALSADNAVEYIDWATRHMSTLGVDFEKHMRAAELAVRVHMGNAQAKATQATLVERGVLQQNDDGTVSNV